MSRSSTTLSSLIPAIEPGQPTRVLEMLSAKYGMSMAQAGAGRGPGWRRRRRPTASAYTVDRTVGNTFDAHRLMHLAGDLGRADALLQRLYKAYFAEGRSVFDAESLAALAGDAGLGPRRGEAGTR